MANRFKFDYVIPDYLPENCKILHKIIQKKELYPDQVAEILQVSIDTANRYRVLTKNPNRITAPSIIQLQALLWYPQQPPEWEEFLK